MAVRWKCPLEGVWGRRHCEQSEAKKKGAPNRAPSTSHHPLPPKRSFTEKLIDTQVAHYVHHNPSIPAPKRITRLTAAYRLIYRKAPLHHPAFQFSCTPLQGASVYNIFRLNYYQI